MNSKIIHLGPCVEMRIKATEDGQGFEVSIKGRFRSDESESGIVERVQKFWETLDIDA